MTTIIDGTAGVTFPAGGVGNPASAVVGLTDTQTLTNKTLTTPSFNSAQVDTVSGTAPLYFARAWVNFNGTGVVAIRASGNVSSITDNGTGDYTVNFTTAMSDANYVVTGTSGNGDTGSLRVIATAQAQAPTVSTTRVLTTNMAAAAVDPAYISVAIFR